MIQLNKQQQEIYSFLEQNKGYIKKGKDTLYEMLFLAYDYKDYCKALYKARLDFSENYYNGGQSTKQVAKQINKKIHRLFFDIETSPNIISSWNVGYNLNIGYENIIKERAIICICWKWEGDTHVNHLTWNNGDDEQMIQKFYHQLIQADEVIGHNGDKYDIKWFNTRCLKHGISTMPRIKSIDTLKLARKHFKFNSNRLDYIGQFLGLGKKISTGGYDLWKKVLDGDKSALNDMVTYCKGDVVLLEKIFNKLEGYSDHKTHIAVANGGDKCDCPKCTSSDTIAVGTVHTASGTIKKRMQCNNCGTYYMVSKTAYENRK